MAIGHASMAKAINNVSEEWRHAIVAQKTMKYGESYRHRSGSYQRMAAYQSVA
jgi:hypothetical protein